MTTKGAQRILNLEQVEFVRRAHGERYEADIAPVGFRLESRKLGFNVTVLPPGKRGFPLHAHRGNEEMFFVLEGRGSLRTADGTHPIRQGDFISLPPGRDSAHQIINDSTAPLRYLAVSTMELPEVVEYPDSGKVGVVAGSHGGRTPGPDSLRHFAYLKDGVDYWAGE
ncbi:MAG TPA: cupin domain-containing protein [Candidatus Polarisedimenticolia bacterium]|nr:cupin domain-containing protein [Candidatus Polarisedimenticolia bacterium]